MSCGRGAVKYLATNPNSLDIMKKARVIRKIMRNESLKKHALFRYIAIVICALVGFQLLFQSSGWNPSSNLSKNQCQSQNSASLPVLVLLKTKLNVDYDAGQWFHMTENYLVHHSRLESGGRLINSSQIIYVFDEGKSPTILTQKTSQVDP